VDIRSGQRLAWENKKTKGFNTTDVPLEFCLLQGEVAEAFDAWRKGRVDVGEELADIAIYLFSLAEMTGVDLQDEVEAKIAKNADRSYQWCPGQE
jgi:NTP pyrophosphatase (non-canonical NTP hydrolase)